MVVEQSPSRVIPIERSLARSSLREQLRFAGYRACRAIDRELTLPRHLAQRRGATDV